jgi:hypothetical protein
MGNKNKSTTIWCAFFYHKETLLRCGGWTSLEFHQIERGCVVCKFQEKCITTCKTLPIGNPSIYVTTLNWILYLFYFYFIWFYIVVCKPWIGDYNAYHKSFHYLVGLIHVGKLCILYPLIYFGLQASSR